MAEPIRVIPPLLARDHPDHMCLIPGPKIAPDVRVGVRWVTPEMAKDMGAVVLAYGIITETDNG